MERTRLVIADDHPIFLQGICMLIEIKYPEISVCAAVSDGHAAVDAVRRFSPDVLLMDIKMPGLSGIEAARLLRKELPALCILLLTTFDEPGLITEAIQSGANGYLLKHVSIDEVIQGMKRLLRGGSVFPAPEDGGTDARQPPVSPRSPAALGGASPRENEIFRLMIRNYSNEMIARELFLSDHTVRNYVSKIYELTGMHNRSQLIIWALKNQML
jgi:DNA-binding NarL/FixJ family response regulator